MNRNNLRGRIIAMFGTILGFAKAVGWSSRKAYDIVNGKQEPTMSDLEVMCKTLEVEIPADFRFLFLE